MTKKEIAAEAEERRKKIEELKKELAEGDSKKKTKKISPRAGSRLY